MKKLKELYSKQKMRFFRGMMFLSVINFLLLVSIFVKQNIPNIMPLTLMIPLTVVSATVLVWFIGYMEEKIGIVEEEVIYMNTKNPIFQKLEKFLEKEMKKQ